MSARDFVYWLQGYFEMSNPTVLVKKEVKMIRRHLDLVFAHEVQVRIKNPGKSKVPKTIKDWSKIEYCSDKSTRRKCHSN